MVKKGKVKGYAMTNFQYCVIDIYSVYFSKKQINQKQMEIKKLDQNANH